MSGRIILGTDDKTTSLLGAAVDGFDNIDELLFVLQHPVQFIVVASAKITHYVLVAEKEHDSAWVVKF